MTIPKTINKITIQTQNVWSDLMNNTRKIQIIFRMMQGFIKKTRS